MQRSLPPPLPGTFYLLEELTQGVFWADVEIYLGGFESIMAENLLETGSAHALLHAIHGEGMSLMPSSA